MGWRGKIAVLIVLVLITGLVWRQKGSRPLIRIDVPPATEQPIPELARTELLVTKDGGYLLENKPVPRDALREAVANLRNVKHGIVIDVVAAPDAPFASVAAALAATHENTPAGN